MADLTGLLANNKGLYPQITFFYLFPSKWNKINKNVLLWIKLKTHEYYKAQTINWAGSCRWSLFDASNTYLCYKINFSYWNCTHVINMFKKMFSSLTTTIIVSFRVSQGETREGEDPGDTISLKQYYFKVSTNFMFMFHEN